MPLSFVSIGSCVSIIKISGKDDTKKFLLNLGFVEGEKISVVSKMGGNIILMLKESRIAIDECMAKRILVN